MALKMWGGKNKYNVNAAVGKGLIYLNFYSTRPFMGLYAFLLEHIL